MPGIHLVARETIYARGAGQMCRQDSRAQMSADEEIAAEGSLSIYCKPVELYNILQRRAIDKPLYLQRCLYYQQQAKNKRRIQMTISLSGTANNQLQTEKVFPIYIFLARPLSNVAFTENAAVYQFSRVCEVTSYIGVGEMNRSQVTFILPEMNKLSVDVESGNFDILLVSCDAISGLLSGNDITKNHTEMTSLPSIGGYGMLAKIPLKQVYLSWEDSLNLRVGERAELLTTVDMHSRVVKLSCLDKEKSISFQLPCNFGAVSTPLQVAVTISAEMVGAKEITPYNSYSYSDSHTDIPMSPVLRVRTGNVIFNYRYHNNTMQRTEVTENFTCPFCLVKCASYKGLRHHLPSSHDLFNFEFWVNEEYQAVNVSVNTDQLRSEIVADGVDPKEQTFCFCSKRFRCRKRNILVQNAKHVHPLVLYSDFPVAINEHRDKVDGPVELLERNNTSSPNATGFSSATAHSYIGPECVQSVSGSNLSPPTMLQLAKIRKLSAERSDPRNRSLLEKRLFFHSHRAQPMELEQVLSDRDSEDEVDDDVADLEDRRMLDDFVDVSKDEKQMMHLWNSFVRKQRVLADGHIPWACEAFSKLHGQELVLAPDLLWCWRLLMIKLWNHGLLDARTMNKCNVTIEQFQSQDVGESRIIAEGEPMIVAEGESDNR